MIPILGLVCIAAIAVLVIGMVAVGAYVTVSTYRTVRALHLP